MLDSGEEIDCAAVTVMPACHERPGSRAATYSFWRWHRDGTDTGTVYPPVGACHRGGFLRRGCDPEGRGRRGQGRGRRGYGDERVRDWGETDTRCQTIT